MKPINQKESVSIHAGPSITIDTMAAQTSIAQTIARTFGDNTMPPEPGSSGSLLSSPIHNPGLADLAARFADPTATTQGSGSSQADPLAGIAADRVASMARLMGMDLANDTDPTQKADLNIGPGLPSADALKAALTRTASSSMRAAGQALAIPPRATARRPCLADI